MEQDHSPRSGRKNRDTLPEVANSMDSQILTSSTLQFASIAVSRLTSGALSSVFTNSITASAFCGDQRVEPAQPRS